MQVVAKQVYEEADDFSKALTIKGRKRIYFIKNRKNQLAEPVSIPGTYYYFEGNVSAIRAMKIIHELLHTFGYKDSDLEIKV